MKKTSTFLIFFFCLMLLSGTAKAQLPCYWVFLTDKAGTTFDPYSYFDAKAIERYRVNNADLYDISNYPLNEDYVSQVNALATEEVGQSRWLNAIAVSASENQIAEIAQLPFVCSVVQLNNDMQPAIASELQSDTFYFKDLQSSYINTSASINTTLSDQLLRMRGDLFAARGIDGTGIRVAVFDGGFHGVNTHMAFKHLRDAKRIIATWDFTKKQEDVYDNHSHGTMVLSCIAGMMNGRQLGLATGAEFLLAKTEVDPEPFKEEVWWMQAMEWADKNGADLINSSLGYTKDRHYTWEMDGRSYVSKAANMAARKGMVVCNSAGNSGADINWKIIGAPADADSIISVGGISPSLSRYEHISFSSYGPTADRRLKPNVCNYGFAECVNGYNDTATTFAAGTSFSSPLTTGFVACVLQMLGDRKLTAMQVKELIEHSADLHPYYDYALGYGVPQASYFTDSAETITIRQTPTFTFENRKGAILIRPTGFRPDKYLGKIDIDNMSGFKQDTIKPSQNDIVLLKIQDSKGRIEQYVNLAVDDFALPLCIAIPKTALGGHTLVVNVNGYTNSHTLSRNEKDYWMQHAEPFAYYLIDTAGYIKDNYEVLGDRTMADNKVGDWGVGQKRLLECYLQTGLWADTKEPMKGNVSCNIGARYLRHFRKWYALGVAVDVAIDDYYYSTEEMNHWDSQLGLSPSDFTNAKSKSFEFTQFNIELFQRFRMKTGSHLHHKGLYSDLGLYGGFAVNVYNISFRQPHLSASSLRQTYNYNEVSGVNSFVFGVTARITYEMFGLYARYRITQKDCNLPHLQFGLQLSF